MLYITGILLVILSPVKLIVNIITIFSLNITINNYLQVLFNSIINRVNKVFITL
jgi:hypothetical protein